MTKKEYVKTQRNPLKYKINVFLSMADRHTDEIMHRLDTHML